MHIAAVLLLDASTLLLPRNITALFGDSMSQRSSAPQWLENHKHILEDLYLDQKLSAAAVAERLAEQYQHRTTVRKLKARFEKWGWRKKISNHEWYFAMDYVIVQLPGKHIEFRVTLTKGKDSQIKLAHQVQREVKRKRETARNGGKPVPESPKSLEEAIQMLKDNGTELIENGEPSNHRYLRPHNDDPDDSASASSEDLPSPPDCHHGMELEATLSEHMLPRPGPKREQPVFTQDLYVHHEVDDLTDFFASMTLGIPLADPERAQWQKYLGRDLGEGYMQYHFDSSTRSLINFAAYYIRLSEWGADDLDEKNHQHRVEARANLVSLLRSGDARLLATMHWISAVLGSNDKLPTIKSFYEDCSDCVADTPSPQSCVLRPFVKIGLLIWNESLGLASVTGQERTQKVEEVVRASDLEYELRQSLEYLRSTGQIRSSANVTIHSLLAWYYEMIGDHDSCLQTLVAPECLPLAGSIMGFRHLVTINSMAMAARCYERSSDMGLARIYLQDATARLENCASPLRAYQHRILAKLAMLHLQFDKHVDEGIEALERVLSFRIKTVGALSGLTCESADELFNVLKMHGRGAEATRRREEFDALRQNEWNQHLREQKRSTDRLTRY